MIGTRSGNNRPTVGRFHRDLFFCCFFFDFMIGTESGNNFIWVWGT